MPRVRLSTSTAAVPEEALSLDDGNDAAALPPPDAAAEDDDKPLVPPGDVAELKEMGAAAIFPPGTVIADAAEGLIDELNARLGYAPRQAAE